MKVRGGQGGGGGGEKWWRISLRLNPWIYFFFFARIRIGNFCLRSCRRLFFCFVCFICLLARSFVCLAVTINANTCQQKIIKIFTFDTYFVFIMRKENKKKRTKFFFLDMIETWFFYFSDRKNIFLLFFNLLFPVFIYSCYVVRTNFLIVFLMFVFLSLSLSSFSVLNLFSVCFFYFYSTSEGREKNKHWRQWLLLLSSSLLLKVVNTWCVIKSPSTTL